MKGRAFLDVLPLLTPVETEASIRTQIGRTYYAAYLEAREWCEVNLGYKRERLGREHGEVARMLSPLDPTLEEDLAFLRTFRNTADYDLHISIETLLLQRDESMKRAERVLLGLGDLTIPQPEEDDDTDEDQP